MKFFQRNKQTYVSVDEVKATDTGIDITKENLYHLLITDQIRREQATAFINFFPKNKRTELLTSIRIFDIKQRDKQLDEDIFYRLNTYDKRYEFLIDYSMGTFDPKLY